MNGNYFGVAMAVFSAVFVVFLFWWFFFKPDVPNTEIVSVVSLQEDEEPDNAPPGYDRFFSEEFNLEFFYPEGWALTDRDFGNTQTIEEADLPLFASSFDLSYFEKNDARIILDLPKELYCEQTNNVAKWQAYIHGDRPVKTNDARCTKPEFRDIGNVDTYTFLNQQERLANYSIFVPLSEGGGLTFTDTIPIPEGASENEAQNLVDSLRTGVREKVSQFVPQNQELLDVK